MYTCMQGAQARRAARASREKLKLALRGPQRGVRMRTVERGRGHGGCRKYVIPLPSLHGSGCAASGEWRVLLDW